MLWTLEVLLTEGKGIIFLRPVSVPFCAGLIFRLVPFSDIVKYLMQNFFIYMKFEILKESLPYLEIIYCLLFS